MAVFNSAGLITNGLSLFYDFNNRKKSYISQTVTNQFAIPTPDGSGNVNFAVNGTGTFQRVYSGTYDGYNIQPDDVVYRYNLGGSGCHYHGNDVTISAGQTATWQSDYYIDLEGGTFSTNYLANFEGVVSGSSSDPSPSTTRTWKSFTFSSTAGSTGLCRMLLYPGACGDRLATSGFVLFKNPQVTFNTYALPYVSGSRTAATGLLDLTRNITTNTLNITYPSGITPLNHTSLNSNNSAVITDSSSILDTDTHSIFFMIRFNTTSSYGSNGYSGNWDKIFSFNAGGSDRTPGVWRWPGERSLHWRYDPGNSGCDFGKTAAGTGNQFDIDTWYYVGVTKNGGSTVMYVNGRSVGTGSVSNPKTAGSSAIYLYEYYPTDMSSMGLLQVYNRVLSDNEVYTNYSALRGRFGI